MMCRLLLVLVTLWALPALASTYVVNDNGDAVDAIHGDDACATSGAVCTFRAAVEEANNHAGGDTIVFGTGAPYVITPASLLPDLNGPLTVDALGCSGTCGATYRLEIQGNEALSRGLLLSGASTVRGVKITGTFASPSSAFTVGGTGAVMECVRVDLTPNGAMWNGQMGVSIGDGSAQVQVLRSIINGTVQGDCVAAGAATDVLVQGNVITGCEDGVYFSASTGAVLFNMLSNHTHNGLHLYNGSHQVVVYGNEASENGQDGLRIQDTDATIIGGEQSWMRNIFAHNALYGVWIRGTSDATHVEGNYFGVYPTPTPQTCNAFDGALRDDGTNTVDVNNVFCPTPPPAPGCCAVTGTEAVSCVSQAIAAWLSLPLSTLGECQELLDTVLGYGNATASAYNPSATCQGVTTPGTGTCP